MNSDPIPLTFGSLKVELQPSTIVRFRQHASFNPTNFDFRTSSDAGCQGNEYHFKTGFTITETLTNCSSSANWPSASDGW